VSEIQRFDIWIGWFGDDQEWLDVDARTFEGACKKAYHHWSKTGWTDLTVYDIGRKRSMSFDLDRPFEDGTLWEATDE
jgi:hypothetical protein